MLERGDSISQDIPEEAYLVYKREIEAGRSRNSVLMNSLLMSRLLMLKEEDFESLPDSAGGAGKRLYKTLRENCCVVETAYYAATRPYPMSRMRRMLINAALGISADYTNTSPPYMRVLSFNQKGREYLAKLENTALPLVTKPSAVKTHGVEAEKVFALGASAHDLFRLQFVTNDDKKPGEDWRKGPIIV